MKLRFTYTAFGVCLLAFLFSSNSGGRAAAANSGNTGAPGDAAATCISCHGNSPSIDVALRIEILDDQGQSITDDGYLPNTVYDVVVTVDVLQGSPVGYGFQMVALNAAEGQNGDPINTWSLPADNVQIINTSNGRTYAEHRRVLANNVFRTKWTAPAEGAGTVTFYSCGNGVNGNGQTGGDNAACATLILEEAVTTSLPSFANAVELELFPNPATDLLQLRIDSPRAGNYRVLLTDLLGRRVHESVLPVPAGSHPQAIPVDHLASGNYTLQLIGDDVQVTRSLIIQ